MTTTSKGSGSGTVTGPGGTAAQAPQPSKQATARKSLIRPHHSHGAGMAPDLESARVQESG